MDTVAPWAELAPLTADILERMPDDGWRYELVQGRLVRMPPTGFDHGRITMLLAGALHTFVRERRLGVVVGSETGFVLSQDGELDTVLAPDAAFIATAHVPAGSVPGFPRLAPDLVCEVASPGQTRAQMEAKARLYLQAGVRLVWVVWPESRAVDVWRAGFEATDLLTESDTLEGEAILPGFSLQVHELFA